MKQLKEIKEYYDSDNTLLREHYFVDYYSRRQGLHEYYQRSGEISLVIPFKNELIHGMRKSFSPDKNMQNDGIWFYKMGEKFGQQKPICVKERKRDG